MRSDVDKTIFPLLGIFEQSAIQRDYFRARLAAASAVSFCRTIREELQPSQTDDADLHGVIIRGVLCCACRDFIDCCELAARDTLSSKQVETIWESLVDCCERLSFASRYLSGPVVEFLYTNTSNLRKLLDEKLGEGTYASIELVIGKVLCTICGLDYRACHHRRGRLYGGRICGYIPEDSHIRASAIVSSPADLRCRIWPWRVDRETNQMWVTMFTVFAVDNFNDPRDASVVKEEKTTSDQQLPE